MEKEEGRPVESGQQTNFTTVSLSDIPFPVKRSQWGPWRLSKNNACLTLTIEGRWLYEVDLEWCHSSARVLDWICQVKKKTWATDTILANLVRGLDDTLQPQANLCSGGQDKRLTSTQLHRMVGR